MGLPAAKQMDKVVGVDIHIVMIPSPGGPVPTPLPSPFNGMLVGGLSTTVKIMGRPAAVVGSTAKNLPPHIPAGGPFQKPPMNEAKVMLGSFTVKIQGKFAARVGDPCMDCNDPADAPTGTVVVAGPCTVMIG